MISNLINHSMPWIIDTDINAVKGTLESKNIANGSVVKKFEECIAKYIGVKGGIACNSGSAALHLCLRGLDIKVGDDIILPTYVCENVLNAVLAVGANPCFCDVNELGVITKDTVQKVITKNSKAIIAVHLFGNFCDINSLLPFNLPVIEDACQSFGLEFNSRQTGSLGTISFTSFHATKCLTTGEGGMLLSNNAELLDKCKKISNSFFMHTMSDLQASLGLSQLKRYSLFLKKRYEILEFYESLDVIKNNFLPLFDKNRNFLFRYILKGNLNFDDLKINFYKNGVHIRRGVDQLLHRKLNLDDSSFKESVNLFNNVISIPFYPSLTANELKIIENAFNKVFIND